MHRRVAANSLEQVDRDIYRVSGVASTFRQRALAACWAHGPDAMLSHRAAGLLWNLDGIEQAPLEVLVPRWGRRAKRQGVITHECTDLTGADRTIIDAVPCTSAVRTLLDLASVLPPRRADQVVEDALRRHLCTVEQLAERFAQVARRGRPGTRLGRALIEKRYGRYVPTMSEFERRTSDLAEAAGLARPLRQHAVTVRDSTVYLDLAWPDVRVGVECDGLFHHASNVSLPWDDDRQNELVLLGWLILRFTWHQLTATPRLVQSQMLQAVRGRGVLFPGSNRPS